MYDLNHSGFHLLGEVMEMASRFPFYANQRIVELRRRFLPSIMHGKIRIYRSGQTLVGFATWAYLNEDEIKTRKFTAKTFERNEGKEVWVIDMCSQSNVRYIAKDMRLFLMKYTNHERAYWNRPNKISNAGRINHGWKW